MSCEIIFIHKLSNALNHRACLLEGWGSYEVHVYINMYT